MTPRQLSKAATRAKVLEAAKTAFETVGYEWTTMRLFANHTAMSTRAIFANFSGKAELYAAVKGHAPISPEVGDVLLAALRPFGINVGAVSLSGALGHVTRQDLLNARAAIALATSDPGECGVSVADGGSTASPKSDSEGGH